MLGDCSKKKNVQGLDVSSDETYKVRMNTYFFVWRRSGGFLLEAA